MRLLSNPNKYGYWLLFTSTEYLKICTVGTNLACKMQFLYLFYLFYSEFLDSDIFLQWYNCFIYIKKYIKTNEVVENTYQKLWAVVGPDYLSLDLSSIG